jgi:hypothetical protein
METGNLLNFLLPQSFVTPPIFIILVCSAPVLYLLFSLTCFCARDQLCLLFTFRINRSRPMLSYCLHYAVLHIVLPFSISPRLILESSHYSYISILR